MAVGLHTTNLVIPLLKLLMGNSTAGLATIAALWVQLHTADPGAAGTTAVSVGDATRKQITFSTPGANVLSLSASPSVWTDAATSETITHISVWSLITAGVVYFTVVLTASQPWVATNTFTLNTLTFTLTPVMA